ncbi:MAG: hypothetical protein ACREVJ_00370 [Gammaproteobacteria bacterium]
MRSRLASRLAWSLCGVVLVLISLTLLLIILGWSTPLPPGYQPLGDQGLSPGYQSWRDQAIFLVGVIGAPILGGLIVSRLPHNPYGWLWLGFGLGLALQQLAASYAAYALAAPGSLVAPRTVSHLLGLGGPLSLAFAPFLLLLFPTGRLPSRRWRLLAWFAAASGAVVLVLNLVFERPDEVGGAILVVVSAAVLGIFATVILSALSLVVRYRRASGVERQQLKWFALAAVLATSYLLGLMLGLDRLLGGAWWNLIEVATNLGLYAAIGVAILRHRLYDIDVIINQTLVYGLLTTMLVLVYLGGVTAIQALFQTFTGQEDLPQLAIVTSTLAIAALFNPLRRRIQGVIDRRFYRRKYDARKVLEAFSARLRSETDFDELAGDLVSVVRETVQPSHASLWIQEVGRERDV